jgi:hypothetical protein
MKNGTIGIAFKAIFTRVKAGAKKFHRVTVEWSRETERREREREGK